MHAAFNLEVTHASVKRHQVENIRMIVILAFSRALENTTHNIYYNIIINVYCKYNN